MKACAFASSLKMLTRLPFEDVKWLQNLVCFILVL